MNEDYYKTTSIGMLNSSMRLGKMLEADMDMPTFSQMVERLILNEAKRRGISFDADKTTKQPENG